ncbi:MAG: hypothetical protein FWF57_04555 [Defluviitaleaceae bacterium]|nr:hypothetical protein [Defluviitaleaceae bacterium]
MHNINLLPQSYIQKRINKKFCYLITFIQAFIFFIFYLQINFKNNEIYEKNLHLNTINSFIDNTGFVLANDILDRLLEIENYTQQTNQFINFFEANFEQQYSIKKILDNILLNFSEQIYFNQISWQNNRILLNIYTDNKNCIPEFIEALNNLNYFSYIGIVSSANFLNSENYDSNIIFSIEILL